MINLITLLVYRTVYSREEWEDLQHVMPLVYSQIALELAVEATIMLVLAVML